MKRERLADRWLDAIVVTLVVMIVGFAATAPRASPEGSASAIVVVPMPATGCEDAPPAHLGGCLLAARATALRE